MTQTDVRDFAAALREVVADHAVRQRWTPAEPCDDSNPPLEGLLADMGWNDLAHDPDGAGFVGPAAFELGRGVVSLRIVDRLLGGSPLVGGMTRYADVGDRVVVPGLDGLRSAVVMSSVPVPYGDALGACLSEVGDGVLIDPNEARLREGAWVTATVGYLAGLASRGCELALEHAATRTAFGGRLLDIESVQQRLADAAMERDGLRLMATGDLDLDGLAFAGRAARRALAECHQILGALGFTLEFPLQECSRRAGAMVVWSDTWIRARS